jgi:3'-phosphoadenosine 5'-phosphosulfate sulfotransferase (PAPS reductase)/FAD synthetase
MKKIARQGAHLFRIGARRIAGIRRTSGRNSGICTTRCSPRRKRAGFPLSNWTELDIWEYILLEDIPIVPLCFAARRPVVERDGALIMVDDERMPLRPGEQPEWRSIRFRTMGCYPLDRRDAVDGDDLAGDRPGDDGFANLRATGTRHRPRQRRIDGTQEGGGLLLMSDLAEPL